MQESKRADYQERAASFLAADSSDRAFSLQTVGTLSIADMERALAARKAVAVLKKELSRDLDELLAYFQAITARLQETGDLLKELRRHWERDEDAARTLARLIYEQRLDAMLMQVAATLSDYTWVSDGSQAAEVGANGSMPLPEAEEAARFALAHEGGSASGDAGMPVEPEMGEYGGDRIEVVPAAWEEAIQTWERVVESWEMPPPLDPLEPEGADATEDVGGAALDVGDILESA
jgi:hypothetical protein